MREALLEGTLALHVLYTAIVRAVGTQSMWSGRLSATTTPHLNSVSIKVTES